ncbi:MAG: ribonuclease III [Lachnospiraceae bacterium]|nr:ribonuclease III [Lachnospiraceae bacterium]
MQRSTELQLNDLESHLGYRFRNRELLRHAVTHSSYANEHHLKREGNNERLEFLGDAVLEMISSENLYKGNPQMPEGELTKLRARLVCEPTLAQCAKEIALGSFLLLGKGEESTGGRERSSILSDAFEAVIGAIYLDGGFTNAKEFIERTVLSDVEHRALFCDSKTILQELIQSGHKGTLSYRLLSEEGPEHMKCFTVCACLDDTLLAEGVGKTKKAAEQEAAYRSILKLRKEAAEKRTGDNICI